MTINPTTPAGLRISGPAELLTGIPRLLGFHPTESLVLVGLTGGTLTVTARLDLTDTTETEPLRSTVSAMLRGGCTAFVAAVFTSEVHEQLPYEQVIEDLAAGLELAEVDLHDALLVRNGQWRSYLCENTACCPPEGKPLPAAPSPFETAATVAGLTALPDRDALADRFTPNPGRDMHRHQLAALESMLPEHTIDGRLTSTGRSMLTLIDTTIADYTPGEPINDADVQMLAVALRDLTIRDTVWARIDNRDIDADDLLLETARRVPAPWNAAPLFLYGWSEWRVGNGALANLAANHALDADPNYSAAKLLQAAVATGINPATLRPLLPATTVRHGGDATTVKRPNRSATDGA